MRRMWTVPKQKLMVWITHGMQCGLQTMIPETQSRQSHHVNVINRQGRTQGQCFACQFLSIVAQISALLVYWEGIGDHISLSALSVCSHRSVGTHMCRQKHAAACCSTRNFSEGPH